MAFFSSTQHPNVNESPSSIASTSVLSHSVSGLLKPYLSELIIDHFHVSLQTAIMLFEVPDKDKWNYVLKELGINFDENWGNSGGQA